MGEIEEVEQKQLTLAQARENISDFKKKIGDLSTTNAESTLSLIDPAPSSSDIVLLSAAILSSSPNTHSPNIAVRKTKDVFAVESANNQAQEPKKSHAWSFFKTPTTIKEINENHENNKNETVSPCLFGKTV